MVGPKANLKLVSLPCGVASNKATIRCRSSTIATPHALLFSKNGKLLHSPYQRNLFTTTTLFIMKSITYLPFISFKEPPSSFPIAVRHGCHRSTYFIDIEPLISTHIHTQPTGTINPLLLLRPPTNNAPHHHCNPLLPGRRRPSHCGEDTSRSTSTSHGQQQQHDVYCHQCCHHHHQPQQCHRSDSHPSLSSPPCCGSKLCLCPCWCNHPRRGHHL